MASQRITINSLADTLRTLTSDREGMKRQAMAVLDNLEHQIAEARLTEKDRASFRDAGRQIRQAVERYESAWMVTVNF